MKQNIDFKGEDYGTEQGVGKLSSSKCRQICRDKKNISKE